MKLNLNLHQKCILIVATPVIISIIFTIQLIHLLQEAEADVKHEAFAVDVMARAAELHRLFYDAGFDIFFFNTTRSERYAAKFDETASKIPILQKELAQMLSRTDVERAYINKSSIDSAAGLRLMKQIRDGAPPEFGGHIDLRGLQRDGMKANRQLIDDYVKIYDYAKKMREETPASSAQSRKNVATFLFCLIGFNVILAFVLAVYFTRAITRRLLVIHDNAARIARNIPLNPPLQGVDEIAAVDQSFRSMALAIAESGRKERALTDNATEVLCSLNTSLKFVKVSMAAKKVWGRDADSLLGTPLQNLFSTDDAENSRTMFQQMINSKEERVFNGQIVRSDGKIIEARWSVYWSESEQSMFCVCHDVTKEQELERLKQQLMDTVAHDLRAPLTSIRAILGLLATGVLGDLTDKAQARVADAERESERLVRLVNDLLDFDRLEAGRFELLLDDVDLDEILDSSIKSLIELARNKNIEIRFLRGDLSVHVDADRLIQVIVNILGNAIKFSPPNSTVVLSSSRSDEMAIVKIADQGPGVADEMVSQVFDRYKQLESSSKNAGFGLGLPIARQIILAHGGTIGMENNTPHGSIFYFNVPLTINAKQEAVSIEKSASL